MLRPAFGALALLTAAAAPVPHMAFRRAEPAPDSRVAVAPASIALWFTGRPQLPFSRIQLTGPNGSVAIGALVADTGNGFRADVRGATVPGAYRVAWQTAGADGHRLTGDYAFTLAPAGVAPTEHAGHAMPSSSTDPTRAAPQHGVSHAPSVPARIARWWEYFGLLGTFGVLTFVQLILPPLAARGVHSADASARARRFGEVVVVIYLAAAAYRLISQVAMTPDGQIASLGVVLRGSTWGQGWLVGAVGAAVVLAGLLVSRKRVGLGTPLALTGAIGMALSPALSGHAAAAQRFVLAVALDSVHVAAIGAWLGGLLVLVLVGIPAMARLTDGNANAAVSALVNSFHPIALVSAPLAVFSGAGSALQHATTLSALATPWGRALLLKLGLVAIVASIGAYNSSRARMRLGTPEGTRQLRRSATAELVLASLVLAATAILTASSLPVVDSAP